MKKILLLTIFSFSLNVTIFSQITDKKWAVEIGASTSILFQKTAYKVENYDTTTYQTWNKIRPMPVIRLSRIFQPWQTKQLFIKPFIGAAVIGTETDLEQTRAERITVTPFNTQNTTENIYYYVPTAEIGGLFSFPIQNFDIEIGLKGQYHFTAWTNHFYYESEIISMNPPNFTIEEVEYEIEDIFTRFSANAGLRVQYNFNRFLIAAESWYGITNLSVFEFEGVEVYQNELNLRLMLGYQF